MPGSQGGRISSQIPRSRRNGIRVLLRDDDLTTTAKSSRPAYSRPNQSTRVSKEREVCTSQNCRCKCTILVSPKFLVLKGTPEGVFGITFRNGRRSGSEAGSRSSGESTPLKRPNEIRFKQRYLEVGPFGTEKPRPTSTSSSCLEGAVELHTICLEI